MLPAIHDPRNRVPIFAFEIQHKFRLPSAIPSVSVMMVGGSVLMAGRVVLCVRACMPDFFRNST